MQLTLYTDYSLRVLLYLALKGEELSTISEIAEHYGVSRNHLVKVVHNLGALGYVHTIRGKVGGLRLARRPEKINIGEVVRHTEANFDIVECFNIQPGGGWCPITPLCRLKGALGEACKAFLGVLERYSLADVVGNEEQLVLALFGKPPDPGGTR